MIKTLFTRYLTCIENSDAMGMSEYWLDQCLMKNYVIESHKAAFLSVKIQPFLIDFKVLHEQEQYVVFEELSKYLGHEGTFNDNVTRTLWVAIKTPETYKFLSCTTLSVDNI